MIAREISFARLEELLTKVGFKTLPSAGKHQVFKEPVSEAMVVLPASLSQASAGSCHSFSGCTQKFPGKWID